MNRLLVVSQILSFGLIGALAFILAGGDLPTALISGSTGVEEAPPGAGATETPLPERSELLEAELATLRQQNRELSLRVDGLELDSLSANAAIDDIQSMALQNSIRLRNNDARLAGAGAVAGGEAAGTYQTIGGDELAGVYPTQLDGAVAVNPEIDQAVRLVLASIDDERREEKQQRQIEREHQLFARMGKRFELSDGQVRVVKDAHFRRRQEFRDIRELVKAGQIPKQDARTQGRTIQDRYRSEVVAVVGEGRYQAVQRFLNPRGDGDRKKDDAKRAKKKQGGGDAPGGSRQR